MKELTQQQRRKILAASEIVEMWDLAVLKKIIEFTDLLEVYEQTYTDKTEYHQGQISEALTKIEEIKKYCEENLATADAKTVSEINKLSVSVTELETKLQTQINSKAEKKYVDSIYKDLKGKIALTKAMIPELPDLSYIDVKFEEFDNKIPVLTETILDGREEIVEKINTGEKKDLKIEAKQIAGYDKLEESISNRAISILDQRTKFLINKCVKHDSTLSGSGTDADPLTVVASDSGHTIQDDGVDMTDRANLDFQNYFTLTDNAG